MKLRRLTFPSLASVCLAIALASATPAQMDHTGMAEPTGQFQRIEQPLWLKIAVTGVGLGLVGLELWWFLWSKPNPR